LSLEVKSQSCAEKAVVWIGTSSLWWERFDEKWGISLERKSVVVLDGDSGDNEYDDLQYTVLVY